MTNARIDRLKDLLRINNVAGYLVPSTDEYMSEYTPDYAKRLECLTGFNGSNGIALILLNGKSILFTDGRYTEQAKKQLDMEIFDVVDLKIIKDFVFDSYVKGPEVIGYDPKVFTNNMLKSFAKLSLKAIDGNLVDSVWDEQPARPNSKVYEYSLAYAGKLHTQKIAECRNYIKEHEANALVITASDSICWLLNLRASDIEATPFMLSLAILTLDKLYLFIDPVRITDSIRAARPEITVLPEERLIEIANNIDGRILIDDKFASSYIIQSLGKKNLKFVDEPCQLLKSSKNKAEIEYAKLGHIQDGAALCEFFASIHGLENIDQYTEYDLAQKLTLFRAKRQGYVMDSFNTIAGFQENSAIIHYKAEKSTAKKISGTGLLLVDSGGQYLGATTDVTRVIPIGAPTTEQKKRYTQVLKGHIALGNAKFPVGTTGANLDVLARQFLWQDGLDYAHGTGHGVGSFLSVHEGPHRINQINNVALKPGMILSNEPGYYLPGHFGIRIENLIYVETSDYPDYLKFTNLTLVPYAPGLIDKELLTSQEKKYINEYHKKVLHTLKPLLSSRAQSWLEKECAEL